MSSLSMASDVVCILSEIVFAGLVYILLRAMTHPVCLKSSAFKSDELEIFATSPRQYGLLVHS